MFRKRLLEAEMSETSFAEELRNLSSVMELKSAAMLIEAEVTEELVTE